MSKHIFIAAGAICSSISNLYPNRLSAPLDRINKGAIVQHVSQIGQ